MLVDCLVQCGSNPAIMLIKELVETEQITESKATWALAAVGYYAKTPTRELFQELVVCLSENLLHNSVPFLSMSLFVKFQTLLKSSPVRSSKTLKQTTMMTIADLLNTACGSRFSAAKRFPVSVLGDFCDRRSPIITEEVLPFLVKELEFSTDTFDRIVTLAAFGSLGVEEIVPYLLPIIRGTPGKFDNTAERVRAILSLHRVVYAAPEKVNFR